MSWVGLDVSHPEGNGPSQPRDPARPAYSFPSRNKNNRAHPGQAETGEQRGGWAALGFHGNRLKAERARPGSPSYFSAARVACDGSRHVDAGPWAGRQGQSDKEDLKATLTAKNREAKQLSQLERTRQRNPSDRHIIAESELQRASMDATRTTRQLEETIDNFEKQKIKDIKNIFSEFITIEMLFHGKALEIYTAAYQNIQNIDENEDLEVFRSSLYPPDHQSRLDIVRANSKSPLQRPSSSKPCAGIVQISRNNLKKEEEEEEEEDDEEGDDEYEDEDLETTKEGR
ncbi:CBY1-interacting BAR domain-containing protein 1 isoform X4 [Pogona vitticeps]